MAKPLIGGCLAGVPGTMGVLGVLGAMGKWKSGCTFVTFNKNAARMAQPEMNRVSPWAETNYASNAA